MVNSGCSDSSYGSVTPGNSSILPFFACKYSPLKSLSEQILEEHRRRWASRPNDGALPSQPGVDVSVTRGFHTGCANVLVLLEKVSIKEVGL